MATNYPVRAIWVTPELKERFLETAWRRRSTVSKIVTDAIERYVEDPDIANTWADGHEGNGKTRISFRVDNDTFATANEIAEAQGIPFAHLIRGMLISAADSVGV